MPIDVLGKEDRGILYISDLENKIEIAINSLTELRDVISEDVYSLTGRSFKRGYVIYKLNRIITDLSFGINAIILEQHPSEEEE